MKHIIISLITIHHNTIAKKIGEFFGKSGQSSDLMFYDGTDKEGNIFIIIDPLGYPEKIKPLLQSQAIGDFQLLLITPDDPLNSLLGEMIVAMEMFPDMIPLIVIAGINKLNEYKINDLKERLKQIIKNSSISDKINEIFVIRNIPDDLNYLKQKIMELNNKKSIKNEEDIKILIDGVFPVKGVGTVILGVVKTGNFKAGEMLELTDPLRPYKNIIVKSIQIQDIDFKEAKKGDRVGLAIKGIKPEEITRDNILTTKGLMKPVSKVEIKFKLNEYYRKTLKKLDKQIFHIAVDHQIYPVKIIDIKNTSTEGELKPGETGNVKFEIEKNLALKTGNNWAIIVLMEKFENKLRFLGSGPIKIA